MVYQFCTAAAWRKRAACTSFLEDNIQLVAHITWAGSGLNGMHHSTMHATPTARLAAGAHLPGTCAATRAVGAGAYLARLPSSSLSRRDTSPGWTDHIATTARDA